MHYQLRIELDGVEPTVWRRVVVPADIDLFHLHRVIQLAMGWEDCHLHDFRVGRKRYALPDPEDWDPAEDEEATRLGDVVKPRGKLVYQYDFGDSWMHTIRVERSLATAPSSPACIDGARACPREDSGGAWGYMDKLAVLADPGHEEHDEIRDWIGADFDAEGFDRAAADKALRRAFRPKPKRAASKKRAPG